MKRVSVLLLVGILAGVSGFAQAQTATVPQLVNYQGKLTDINGNPLATGNYTLEFNIYAAKTGGPLLWGPLIFDGGTGTGHASKVPVVNGFFNVFLGPEDTDGDPVTDAFAAADTFLGIKVDGGAELAPRQQILSSPYALQSHNADTVDSLHGADILTKSQYDGGSDGRVNAADHATNATNATEASRAAILGSPARGNKVTLPSASEVRVNAASVNVQDTVRTRAQLSQGGDLHLWDGSGNKRAEIWDSGTGLRLLDGTRVRSWLDASGFLGSYHSNGNQVNIIGGGAHTYRTPNTNKRKLLLTHNGDNNGGALVLYGPNGNRNAWGTFVTGTPDHGYFAVTDATGVDEAGIYVNGSSQGVVFGDTKSFIVDHPTRPGHKIQYISLEGPEAGMYHRGIVQLADGRATIQLPEHFSVLASTGTITVQLTPGSASSKGLAVTSVGREKVEIAELSGGAGAYDVHFLVHAVRAGYESHNPVIAPEEVATRLPQGAAGTPVQGSVVGGGGPFGAGPVRAPDEIVEQPAPAQDQ